MRYQSAARSGLGVLIFVFSWLCGTAQISVGPGPAVPSLPDTGKVFQIGFELNQITTPVRKVGTLDTGIAFRNTSPEPMTVRLALKGASGTLLASAEREVAPMGRTAEFITTLFPDFSGLGPAGNADFEGSLVLQSATCCFSAVALELDVDKAFTTLPASGLTTSRRLAPPPTLPSPSSFRLQLDDFCQPRGSCGEARIQSVPIPPGRCFRRCFVLRRRAGSVFSRAHLS